ncbi:MAG TPA: ABC transporter ATP-binding protein [Spirochaetia bacterium]|nr:ABC transporter ATP-binding protein [Spirochaetia bacterium]
MLKLFRYLKPYWRDALVAPLLMIVEVTSDLLQPTFLARIVDRGVANGDLPFVLRTGLEMIGVVLVGALGGIGCTITASRASMRFAADLRRDAYRRIQSLSFARQDAFSTSSLVTRLTNDVVQMQNLVLMMLRVLVRAPLLCLGGIALAVALNPRLSLVLVVALPLLIGVMLIVVRRGFPLFATVQEKLDRVNAVMQENLSGVRVVKAFVRAPRERERFGAANDALRDSTVRAQRSLALTNPLMMLVMNLSVVAVIWFGGIQVHVLGIGVGQLMAFVNYLIQIMSSFAMVAFMLLSVSRAFASARRLNEVLDAPIDIADAARAGERSIRDGGVVFDRVSFRYEESAGDPVLSEVSLRAEPGETVAILGSTGSGKSTLVGLIPRFHEATAGRVLVDGHDVSSYRLEALRGSIGVVLQDSILFTGTIRENIRWGKEDATEEEIIQAARDAQAHEFISGFPDGYDTVLGQGGVNLSGGQKQRLAIARALVRQPAVLILDDSTSAVDMGTEARIQAALRSRPRRCTCFVIAQRISTVMDADRIVVLENGRVDAMGTHQELLERSAVYREICASQLGEEAAGG